VQRKGEQTHEWRTSRFAYMLMDLDSHWDKRLVLRKHLLQQELQLLPSHLLVQPPLASLLAWVWAHEETDSSPPVTCPFGPEETTNGSFATGLGLGLWLCLSILLSFRSLPLPLPLWVSLWLVSTLPLLLPMIPWLWLWSCLRLCLRL
jgi:hypothetical protein